MHFLMPRSNLSYNPDERNGEKPEQPWRKLKRKKELSPNTKEQSRKKKQSTDVINSDVTKEFLVEKATKHNDLRFSDWNSGMTTEKPCKNQSDKSSIT